MSTSSLFQPLNRKVQRIKGPVIRAIIWRQCSFGVTSPRRAAAVTTCTSVKTMGWRAPACAVILLSRADHLIWRARHGTPPNRSQSHRRWARMHPAEGTSTDACCHDTWQVRPSEGDKSYSDLEVVKELRAMANTAKKVHQSSSKMGNTLIKSHWRHKPDQQWLMPASLQTCLLPSAPACQIGSCHRSLFTLRLRMSARGYGSRAHDRTPTTCCASRRGCGSRSKRRSREAA